MDCVESTDDVCPSSKFGVTAANIGSVMAGTGIVTAFGISLRGRSTNFLRICSIVQTFYSFLLLNVRYPLDLENFLSFFKVAGFGFFPNLLYYIVDKNDIYTISPLKFVFNGV
jgi:hypothetical protein